MKLSSSAIPRGDSRTKFQRPNEDMCRMYVEAFCPLPLLTCSSMDLAWRANNTIFRQSYILRSYVHPNKSKTPKQRNPEARTDHDISVVALATSAAPLYFRPVKLDENESVLIDGDLGAKNSSEEVWKSIKQLDRGNTKTVDINVSIQPAERQILHPRRNPNAAFGK